MMTIDGRMAKLKRRDIRTPLARPRSPRNPVTTLCNIAWIVFWTVTVLIAWFIVAVAVGVITGRASRDYPSPNHPAMRAHKKLTDGRPLDPYETAAWEQLQEKLR